MGDRTGGYSSGSIDENNALDENDLEKRIFYSFSLIAVCAAFLASLINIYIQSWGPLGISCGVFILQSIIYYIGRNKKYFRGAVFASIFVTSVLLAINYFYNAGIKGPSILYLAITLYFAITVVPLRQTSVWLVLNVVLVAMLALVEYYYPHLVIFNYTNRSDYFVDMLFSYMVVVFIIFWGTLTIRKSNRRQRKEIEQKAIVLGAINKEKDKLFSIISHDLRSPLASIQQYLEALSLVELNAEERAAIQHDLLESTKSTHELLNNLLAWSQNQLGRTVPQLSSFNLKDKISATLEHMALIAAKKEIGFQVAVPDNLLIYADENMLNLVIRNLIYNALKFTSPEGTVKVTAQLDNQNCLISIDDNGSGITEEDQKDIFSLNIVSKPGTDKEQGTGLGLMLCREYMERQNGKIWFTSQPNVGTTFYISLPRKGAEESC